ncbi:MULTISPECIES: CatB-related O-acetyltransferase [Achromobacter]|uniref:CatB-related O-acetyltransferase n=1 Tax=Achromobacter spanius TaxID=217203 RepID=A0ABY8GRV3_9BURK|nr:MULTISPECIES: CatB-related O-acetyltransferase [Achromobacter]WAI83184.1 CatB-related O-acetyltransferase [Achromobacter spanius]WEX93269.1 CatB-related O-acetyltransferase [Achromobacter sp. SS2-2022]WFP07573.1 CatB-related O-acetyltransferase [Achromobacter spanius]
MKSQKFVEMGLTALEGYVPSKFRFEQGVNLGKCEILPGAAFGFQSYMNSGFVRSAVIVGRYCSIGRNVTIGSGVHDLNALSTSPFFKNNSNGPILKLADPVRRIRVLIGHDVWIGDNAYIMSGVTVGDGAVIAAGAVVTHDVQPYSIVLGSPAKHFRWRFEDEVVRSRLSALRWHEFDPELLQHLDIGQIHTALAEMESWPESARTHKALNYRST